MRISFSLDWYENSLSQDAFPVPLLCKEGRGEVDPMARMAPLCFMHVRLYPTLPSPYKGEEKG